MINPLSQYDKETTHVFLDCLGMGFKVNVIVFKSDCNKCEILDLINPDNKFEKTFHFVWSDSVHVDPVVPILYQEVIEDQESDSDESIVIVDVIPSSSSNLDKIDVKNENLCTDFDISSNDESDEGMTETYCIPEKDTENVPDNFDFYKPSASHLLECILHPAKY